MEKKSGRTEVKGFVPVGLCLFISKLRGRYNGWKGVLKISRKL